MSRNPASYTSKTYELKIDTFKKGRPEELLKIMNNFNTSIDGTGTISAYGRINYLHTLLCGEALK